MPPDTTDNATQTETTRSAVSNGSRVTLFGDQRSAGARRYRDLAREFSAEIGQRLETLPPSSGQLVRRLAQVSVELELLEATRAAGQAIDPVTFTRLVGVQRRLLRDLERLKAAQPAARPPSLAEHLARHTATQNAGEAA